MPLTPTPTQAQIFKALGTVLLGFLPTGAEVVQGQANRVPQPKSSNYVVMTMLRRDRIATNIDTYDDCAFTGSIAGTALTVQAMRLGALAVGRPIFGTGAATPPVIVAVASPTIATLSQALTVSSRPLAAGAKVITQKTDIVVQLDVYSDDMATASDMAQTISTMLRDDSGVLLFRATDIPVTPLYADDPKQLAFVDGAGQYESRYMVECHLQADQVITPSQEFADTVEIDRVAADLFFPA